MRRIVTRFEASGGNVRAVLGGMGAGYERTAMQARTLAREQSLLNNQLRAFGTTMRYAIAGTAVFGAAGTISTLSQIQTQLGQISALSGFAGIRGPGGRNVALTGQALDDLGQQVREASINVVQPISAINDAILNLLSTSQGLKQNEIVPIIEEMAKGATIAQTPIENLTQAAASMNIAFQQAPSLENFRKFSREWTTLIGLAPGLRAAGPQVIQQFGPLAAVARGSRFNQEQLMTLILGSLRFGGSPATALRGTQFLLSGLSAPPSKQAAEALAEAGVTPSFTAQHGGWAALMKVLEHVQGLGGTPGRNALKDLANISDEDLDMGKLPPALASGPAMEWLRKATGRVHAQRAAIILAAQLQTHGDVLSLMEDFNKISDKTGEQTRAYQEGWQNFLDRAQLPRAAQSLQVLGQDIATAFEPFLNFGARGITKIADLATKHQDVTSGVAIAGGLAALLYGSKKIFTPKDLGRMAGRAGGVAGGAFVISQGLTGAEGQWAGMPGESVTHPAFVWVLGTGLLPGSALPVPGGRGGGASGKAAEAGRFNNLMRGAVKYSLVGAAAYFGAKAADSLMEHIPGFGGGSMSEAEMARKRLTYLGSDVTYDAKRKRFIQTLKGKGASDQGITVSEEYVAKRLHMTIAQLEKKLGPNKFVGKASVDVNVNVKHPDGTTTRKKTGISMNLFDQWQDTPLQAPSSRGQGKTSRG